MMGVPTPEATVTAIAELAGQMYSAREIAAQLGLTRNQVIGICHRRKIQLGHTPRQQRREPRPADGEAAPQLSKPRARRSSDRGCRWPMWGDQERPSHVYCARAPEGEGQPYCRAHADRAYARGAAAAKAIRAIDRDADRAASQPQTVAA